MTPPTVSNREYITEGKHQVECTNFVTFASVFSYCNTLVTSPRPMYFGCGWPKWKMPFISREIREAFLIAKCISARLWIENLFSPSMYVCTWWVTFRNVTWNIVTYVCPTQDHRYRPYVRPTVWHIQICLTQIDVVDCGWQRSLVMEMEVGDDGTAGP